MSGGVEHHPNMRLRLMVGGRCSQVHCPSGRGVEIVDGDVEVDHHLLCVGFGRPHRALVVGFVLERQAGASLRRLQHRPTVFGRFAGARPLADRDRPPEQLFVERGKGTWIRRTEHGRGEACAWGCHAHILRQRMPSCQGLSKRRRG